MPVTISPIHAHAGYHTVEQLQRQVWGLDDMEVVPLHLLLTVTKNGGLLLGAWDGDQLVGFVFGFPGLASDGTLKHCSHMAGVLPAYRGQHIGYRLKLAQREQVLAQGIRLVTWTYDPLESRNAALNLHKLGATSQTYLPDLYGPMRDALNAGLASDRLQVDWILDSPAVLERLQGAPQLTLDELCAAGTAVWNEPRPGLLLRPSEAVSPLPADRLLLCIPADFQAVKHADPGLARAWRLHTRALFQEAFGAGFTAVDLLAGGDRCYYLLRAGPDHPAPRHS